MRLDKEDLFWVGNVVGLIVLLVAIAILAPQKERERQEYLAKQKLAATKVSPTATTATTTSTSAAAPSKEANDRVVTAIRSIKMGAVVGSDDVALKPLKNDQTKSKALADLSKAVGKKALHEIEPGDVLTDSDLQPASGTK
ncbi:MAG TPA: SAF domain-containing protein [Planktothrix sp.]|jgi:flagella basal body P-ring formation protein FlgA